MIITHAQCLLVSHRKCIDHPLAPDACKAAPHSVDSYEQNAIKEFSFYLEEMSCEKEMEKN
jgi:hypothetical protein